MTVVPAPFAMGMEPNGLGDWHEHACSSDVLMTSDRRTSSSALADGDRHRVVVGA